MRASTVFRGAALCLVVAACSVGPLGETVGCACAEEYFAYADIERWEAGSAKGNVADMVELQRYYRAKGWHQRADDLFNRRIQAGDPTAITEQKHVEELKRAASRNDVDAIGQLSAHFERIGQLAEAKRMHVRLVELGDPYALDDDASDLFNESLKLPDQSPEKLEKLRMARNYYQRVGRQVSFMDATTMRGSNLSRLLRPGERGVAMQTLVDREIKRLER